jgi:innexin
MNETIPTLTNSHMRRRRSIYYYQWLPILLALQSLFFLIPRFIWSTCSSRCGINLQHCLSPKFDYRTSRYKVHHMTTMLNLLARAKQHDFNRMTSDSTQNASSNTNDFFSNRSAMFKFFNLFCIPLIFINGNAFHGYYLANLFLVVKILFLLNSSVQLFLLNALLTKNSILYGLEVLENFRQGEYVVGTRIFPLNVYCDFNIMKIGQPTVYTVG